MSDHVENDDVLEENTLEAGDDSESTQEDTDLAPIAEAGFDVNDFIGTASFKVLGHPVAASFKYAEYVKFKAFSQRAGLTKLEGKIAKLATEAGKALRSPGAVLSQSKLIDTLNDGIQKRFDRIARTGDMTEEDEAYVEKMSTLLDKARNRFDEIRQDPEALLILADQENDKLEPLYHERRDLALRFVFELVQAREGKEFTDKLQDWRDNATGQDLINAYEVVRLGNDQHSSSGGKPQRHWTPQKKRVTN